MTEAEIRRIFAKRRRPTNPTPRRALSPTQRAQVRDKTAGTCHVCGGPLDDSWQVDHVKPHHLGGKSSVENSLPICAECNRLRWSYEPEALRLMMRFGRYAKQEIRHDTKLGRQLLRLAAQNFQE